MKDKFVWALVLAGSAAVAVALYAWFAFTNFQNANVTERRHLCDWKAGRGFDEQCLTLVADQTQAEFAYAIHAVGIVGTLTTIAGFVLVGLSLRETRRATQATRDIGENQNRAYVRAETAELMFPRPGEVYVLIHYENSGLTPATRIRHAVSIAYRDEHTPRGGEALFNPAASFRWMRPIPAGKTEKFKYALNGPDMQNGITDAYQIAYDALAGENQDQPKDKLKFLTFIGAIIYEDVFGKTYRTAFEFKADFYVQSYAAAGQAVALNWGKRKSGGEFERFTDTDHISREAGYSPS